MRSTFVPHKRETERFTPYLSRTRKYLQYEERIQYSQNSLMKSTRNVPFISTTFSDGLILVIVLD